MKWLDLSPIDREAALTTVAARYEIDTPSVEKDWWVTAVLRALFQTSFAPYLLFKGGTSLSKGWQLIHRFSEDIDISLSRDWFAQKGYSFAAGENKSQRERLQFCPPAELLDAFRADYANMISAFIFKEAPDFDKLMARIAELQDRFRKM